jgi:eukaryotic-like serine/threonine-protein kinase
VRVEPRGLVPSDVARLAQWIAGRPLPEALTRAVTDRTAGHPLFVEQIVLELKDRDLLDREGVELPVTLTVEAAVQSRLDHLPPGEKDACKRASVLGRPFTAEELTAMGVASAEAVLGSLGKRDLLAGRARAGGGRGRVFQFRSTLVADVAYSMIADETRRDLHRRAALYLGGRPQADEEEVATHHERGGEPQKAADRYAAAAIAAAQRGDTPTVLRCSERSLALGAPAELRFKLHMARADALGFLGRRDDQDQELQLARDLAENDAELARVLMERSMLMMRTGRQATAPDEAAAAVTAALRAGDAELLTLARVRHMRALAFAGKPQRAAEVLAEAAALASAATVHTRAFLADARAQLAGVVGDLGERREAFEAAVALFREAGDLRRAAGAEANLADAYNRFGEYGEAETALRQALEAGRRVNNRMMEGYALVNLGYALSMQGKIADAVVALDAAQAIATTARELRLSLWARAYRARAKLLDESTFADIIVEAERVAGEAERAGDRGLSVVALTIAARASLAAGRIDEAARISAEATEKLETIGGIEEDEAEVFLTYARSLEAVGRGAEAKNARERGRARVEQIAAQISNPRWRKQFLEGVRAHQELTKAPLTAP